MRFNLFLFIVVSSSFFLTTNTFSQENAGFSQPNEIAPAPIGARYVYAADLDGDGDMDVLSASRQDRKIAWYENLDGLGNFSQQRIIDNRSYAPKCVKAADIDGDGDLDIISSHDAAISWHENLDGKANFGPKQVITIMAHFLDEFDFGDLDSDGDIDILSASSSPRRIVWHENLDGLGSFGSQKEISDTNLVFRAVHCADIDGDGDLDAFSAARDISEIAIYKNLDGKGTFDNPVVFSSEPSAPNAIFSADIDGDGDLDILSSGHHEVAWCENTNGLGDLGPGTIIPSSGHPIIKSAKAADLDGDGDMDILCVIGDEDQVVWFNNTDGKGNFSDQIIITSSADLVRSTFAADLDGDGDIDVLSASEHDDKVAWYKNKNGLGSFEYHRITAPSVRQPKSIVVADLDGDNDLDVISASVGDTKVSWYENLDSLGNFGFQKIINPSASGPVSVCSGDLDGDGDSDIICASERYNGVTWYENTDGLGNFGLRRVISDPNSTASYVHTADLDGDGDLDVLSVLANDKSITWFENTDGLGSFGYQHNIAINTNRVQSIYSADLDGDGDLDVLSASRDDNKLTWYENKDGKGNIGNPQDIDTNLVNSNSVHAEDLDGDGDLDVLGASPYEGSGSGGFIAWYENTNGLGHFGPKKILSDAHGTTQIKTGDLDGDGDKDVFYSNGNKIGWNENLDGKGTFGPNQIITNSFHDANSIIAGDLDGDGDMDILGSAHLYCRIAWFENLIPTPTISPTPSPTMVNVSFPFFDGFESGNFENYWQKRGTNTFRSQINSEQGPHNGSYSVVMDSSDNTQTSRNELNLSVNLTNQNKELILSGKSLSLI